MAEKACLLQLAFVFQLFLKDTKAEQRSIVFRGLRPFKNHRPLCSDDALPSGDARMLLG